MRYEFKKLFASKWQIIIAILFAYAITVSLIQPFRIQGKVDDTAYDHILSDILSWNEDGEKLVQRIQNKIDTLHGLGSSGESGVRPGKYSPYEHMDRAYFIKARDLANYIYFKFDKDHKQIIDVKLLELLQGQDQFMASSQMAMNEKMIFLYNRKFEMHLVNVGKMEYYSYFNLCNADYLILIFIVLLTVRLFALDEEMKSRVLIVSSKCGRKKHYFLQYCAILLIAFVLITMMSILEMILAVHSFGMQHINEPIQMYEEMEMCPFLISIHEFLIIKYLCRILLYVCIISIVSMTVTALHHPFVSNMLLLSGILTPLYIFVRAKKSLAETELALSSTYDTLRTFLPQCLLDIKPYFSSFDYVSLFGIPVPRLVVLVSITVGISTIFFLTGLCMYGKARIRRV